jgi:hypothetical protein
MGRWQRANMPAVLKQHAADTPPPTLANLPSCFLLAVLSPESVFMDWNRGCALFISGRSWFDRAGLSRYITLAERNIAIHAPSCDPHPVPLAFLGWQTGQRGGPHTQFNRRFLNGCLGFGLLHRIFFIF